jgi:endonuclease/exonuclease/phosphatase family metal-dependent hydrolase
VSFSVLTWNSFGAAQGPVSFLRWRGVPDAHRFEHPHVRETITHTDVFCMQEIYLSEAETFFDALAHGDKYRDDNKTALRPLTFGGSGLGIATHARVAAHDKRAFSPPHVHTERFARKGMLHVRVEIDGALVDVVTTHMQSGGGVAARVIRKRQLGELRRYLDDVGRAGAPMIVCGDLNIDGLAQSGRAEYAAIARALPAFVDLGAAADHVTYDTENNALARRHAPNEPPQRLDYMFLADPRGVLEVEATERALHVALESKERPRTFASDHYALGVRFRVRRP